MIKSTKEKKQISDKKEVEENVSNKKEVEAKVSNKKEVEAKVSNKKEVESSVSNETVPTIPDKKQTSLLPSYIKSYSKTQIESTTLDYFWKIDEFNRIYRTLNSLNSPTFPENGSNMIEMNIRINIIRSSDTRIPAGQLYVHTDTNFIGSCYVCVMHSSETVTNVISGHIKDKTLLIEISDFTRYPNTFMLHCKFEIFYKMLNSTIQMNLLPSSVKNVKSIENTIVGESEFNNKSGNSIKFIVGDEHYVVPKKLLCATHSNYFGNLCLTYEEKEKDMTNELTSSELLAFKQLLLFIITGSIKQHDYDMLKNLLTIADKYDVLHLKLICEHYLLRYIMVENAIELILFAFSLNATFLEKHVVIFIKFHLKEIMNTQKFRALLQEDLNKIMELFEKHEIHEMSTDILIKPSK